MRTLLPKPLGRESQSILHRSMVERFPLVASDATSAYIGLSQIVSVAFDIAGSARGNRTAFTRSSSPDRVQFGVLDTAGVTGDAQWRTERVCPIWTTRSGTAARSRAAALLVGAAVYSAQ